MAKHSSHILDMARKGAEHRYDELKAEITALVKNFPHLGSKAGRAAKRGGAAMADAAGAFLKPIARKRRKLSAKARKAISDAQKARWAKHKAAKSSK